jgi:Rrf2 family protein
MFVTQKCQYALRAVFELARRRNTGPIKIAQIAEAQDIPIRFLEVILSQLKQGGFVASRRGTEGGYQLAMEPRLITVGAIVRFVDGEPYAEKDGAAQRRRDGDLFEDIWIEAQQAVQGLFEGITLEQLIERDQIRRREFAMNYEI